MINNNYNDGTQGINNDGFWFRCIRDSHAVPDQVSRWDFPKVAYYCEGLCWNVLSSPIVYNNRESRIEHFRILLSRIEHSWPFSLREYSSRCIIKFKYTYMISWTESERSSESTSIWVDVSLCVSECSTQSNQQFEWNFTKLHGIDSATLSIIQITADEKSIDKLPKIGLSVTH